MVRRQPANPNEHDATVAERQRLDKWLVYARFVKTRAVAAELIARNHVRLNGARLAKPDRVVTVGDVLTLALPHETVVVRVNAMADRRGSAEDAHALYQRVEPGLSGR